ncbi:NADH-quinone oxidoreductase subunit N [Deinobacterium chartae]|uniref:NADH-quinone oxidoreductase subunit N n=1 Tax=Deinobacterium chartae TaxID=521158 RepID=A0A841HYI1_9DEIO|nr:NADH-quinone oxidoreductase subunit N [Deinobacterium chartae]MBB6096972.1 NADH-quinone oxidoreductase subunit N [Deinobacterium chartae]
MTPAALNFPDVNFVPLLPVISVLLGAVIATLLGFYTSRRNVALVGSAFLVIALASLVGLWDRNLTSFDGAFRADNFALAFAGVILIGALLATLASLDNAVRAKLSFPEFDAILLFAVTGTLLIAFAGDLVVLLIGLEVMSLASYILATFQDSRRAEEAGMKYFLLGSVGSAILIYGIALVFGATGHFDFVGIAQAVSAQGFANEPLLVLGALLLLAGFAFKVALAPFHQWTPDVYAGSPTVVTLFMSIVIKTAAFAGLLRVFQQALPDLDGWLIPAQVLIGLTVIVGNLTALRQSELKRMLAYSAIAHSGFLMLGVLAEPQLGGPALIYYLLSYTLMNAAAFAVVAAIQRDDLGVSLEELRGLYYRRPGLAIALALVLASLGGLPPMAGFVGKYVVFAAAYQSGFVGITLLAVITSMIALAFYLRPAVLMFSRPQEDSVIDHLPPRRIQPYSVATAVIGAVGTLLLGVLPQLVYGLLQGGSLLQALR